MSERRRVNIVPHTHWDREWYQPFQSFRMRLVALVDGLLELMESEPSFSRYLLDGQMAVVDDYLEVRPENAERLRRLAASRRLSCGPWYILMDEFLVSAETIVRNLQLGIERAASFGGAMQVGYLPDMFGHIAQMPQILAQAGLEDAVVWRGVPSAVDRSAFTWVAPDGSRVRAEYLITGYSEGASMAEDAKRLVRRIEAYEDRHRSMLVGPILLMTGTDHETPRPWLGRVVAEANEIQDRYEIVLSSLAEAIAGGERRELPEWHGELRAGARANVLMGVLSNHVDVKQAAARTERAIERYAEPLAALFGRREDYPTALLAIAWREMVRNSAHDSICACSHDEVVAAVLHRFAEARRIAEGVRDAALAALGRSFADAGQMVLNLSPHPRSGVVELLLPGSGAIEGAQVLSERAGLDAELVLTVPEIRAVLDQIDGDQFAGDAFVTGVTMTPLDDVEGPAGDDVVLEVEVEVGAERNPGLVVDETKRDLLALLALRPGGRVRVRLAHTPSRRLLVRVEDVPAYGWTAFSPAPLAHPVAVEPGDSDGEPITVGNGLVTVVLDPADGTFALDGLAGFNRLVDSGDHGDTYNYSPPASDSVVEAPVRTRLSIVETGPVRGIVDVHRSYVWPERIDEASRARVGERTVEVKSRVELRAGERLVRVTTTFDNPSRDHRLRALFPLPEPAGGSRAECSFAVVERGLEAEGGPTERALATYPSRRFVQAGGLTVCHEGLNEYELVEIVGEADGEPSRLAHGLALTLLRATGLLSRVTMLNRPLPAGPNDPLRSSQMLGPCEARYAVALGEADPYLLADEAFLPLVSVPSLGGGRRAVRGSALTVNGAEVSAVHRVAGGALEVRVFNPTPEPAAVSLALFEKPARGYLVDLLGDLVAPFEQHLVLAPWRFATLRLRED